MLTLNLYNKNHFTRTTISRLIYIASETVELLWHIKRTLVDIVGIYIDTLTYILCGTTFKSDMLCFSSNERGKCTFITVLKIQVNSVTISLMKYLNPLKEFSSIKLSTVKTKSLRKFAMDVDYLANNSIILYTIWLKYFFDLYMLVNTLG